MILKIVLDHIHLLEILWNQELIKIDGWFRANKLTANINKASKFMVSYATRNCHYDLQIKMGNSNLERVNTMKYLGVILDDKMTWNSHIDYIRKKLASASGMISNLKYYVDVQTLIKIYHALLKSKLQYGILSWGFANKTALQPIRVLQNRTVHHISRSPLFTRLDNVYLNYRILKFDDLFKLEVGKFMHQFKSKKLPNSFN